MKKNLSRIALRTLHIAMAGMFLFAGEAKIAGQPHMIAAFDAIGLGQWFRYFTGILEVASGAALLVPSLAVYGALLLTPTMIGAVITHLFIIGGDATPAAVLLSGSLLILWSRREQLVRAIAARRAGFRSDVLPDAPGTVASR